MADRVKPLKLESSDSGGTENDDFPTSLNKNEDHIDCRGIVLQNDSSDDETVVTSRDSSNNMTFKDGVVSGTKTLADLLAAGSFDVDTILTSEHDGTVVTNQDGNILVTG